MTEKRSRLLRYAEPKEGFIVTDGMAACIAGLVCLWLDLEWRGTA